MTRTILHVSQPHDAGVPFVAAGYVADQLARGWEVAVASPPDGDLRRAAETLGARYLPWPAARAPGPATVDETRRLGQAIAAVRPDVVHLHSAKAGMAGRMLLRGRVPTIFQPHAWSFEAVRGPLHAATVAWERLAARWSTAVLCVSEGERRRGEEAGVRARFVVVPNGLDLTEWTPAGEAERRAARAALGIDDGPVAVAVGRLCEQKGQDVLLRAWPEVAERVPGARLILVGDGPYRESLEASAPADVRFAGNRGDVSPWLAAATVVTLPSRWEGGLSTAALEAMARGRSIVASDFAGARDGLSGGAGAVVPVEDAKALARELAARLADPEQADREGAAGRQRMEAAYDLRTATARVAELYDQLLAERAR